MDPCKSATEPAILFAYNAWNKGTASDLGIGNDNDPNTGNTEWTFAYNAPSCTVKELSVWVETTPVPEPVSAGLILAGLAGLSLVRRQRRAGADQTNRPSDESC